MGKVVKSVSYHLQIYEILKEKILSGELKCGERVNELGLAQEMGVSRSPVREALRMLEQDEFVVNGDSGLIINPMEYEDVMEVYDCRIALESFAAKLGCQRATEEVLEQLEQLVAQSLQYHDDRKMQEVIRCNTKFHDIIIELCPNKHLKNMIERNKALSLLARNREFSQMNRPKDYLEGHLDIIKAIRTGDGGKVEEIMREHISGDKDFYIQCFIRHRTGM